MGRIDESVNPTVYVYMIIPSVKQTVSIAHLGGCTDYGSQNNTVLNVSGQNVQFVESCSRVGRIFMLKTDKGLDYIVRKSKRDNYLSFKFPNGAFVRVLLTGFTNAWNNFWGDAI